nr:exostosin-2 isoform X1 [Onthophagus taurus]
MTIPIKSKPLKISSHDFTLYKKFFIFFFIILLISFITISLQFIDFPDGTTKYKKVNLYNLKSAPEVIITNGQDEAAPTNSKCTFWDCFNIYKCGMTGHDRITVYVYPLKKYTDEKGIPVTETMSKEYFTILETIVESKYYTANPYEACLFVPAIDTLSQERLRVNLTSKVLATLPHWGNGVNHLIFNMLAGVFPDFSTTLEINTGKALIAGADFDSYTFRYGFDVSLPVFSPFAKLGEIKNVHNQRDWLVLSTQISIDPYFAQELQDLQLLHSNDLLILDECREDKNYTRRCDVETQHKYRYPQILQKSKFCLVFRGERMGQLVLLEAMAAGCVPVIVEDGVVMPFHNVIDWKRAAVFIMEEHIRGLMDVLANISEERRLRMRKQVLFLYRSYFKGIKEIVGTVLNVIQDRVYPQWGRVYDDWNMSPEEKLTNPLFLPITAPRNEGFTAVILTYDRVQSLFVLIEKLAKVPSLMKVIVVWNNQRKSPPSLSSFPQIQKPLKIIQTRANKLSNRFYPYEEIQTEAVLSIDDDIVMLTADELEFGYEVWREFPDRLIGYPSRTHIWDNTTLSWKYESEWTNEISMVLTGAAFLHKYWHYLYTTSMPSEVKDWVDDHMNCEDIAMNFLVANVTNKPPIKVAPRKKFKCPECVNNEMLSADLGHMIERSKCVDRFAKAFGRMPLKSVEFRADPVLYKDPFPEKLKRFNDIGSL